MRFLLAGALALGAVGSCELPKPKIPSLGAAPVAPRVAETRAAGRAAEPRPAGRAAEPRPGGRAAEPHPAGRAAEIAAEVRPVSDRGATALQ